MYSLSARMSKFCPLNCYKKLLAKKCIKMQIANIRRKPFFKSSTNDILRIFACRIQFCH